MPEAPKTKNRRLVVALALVMALLVMQPPRASTAAPSGGLEESALQGVKEDAKTISERTGEDPDAAFSRLSEQYEMDALAHAAEVAAPESFAGAWVEPSGSPVLHIRVVGEVRDSELEELAESAPVRVSLTYGASASLMAKRRFADGDVFDKWAAENAALQGAIVGEVDDRIVLQTTKQIELPAHLVESARAAGIVLETSLIDEPLSDTNRGGRNMDTCTSGFVYSDGGPNQLVLARHCLAQSYWFFNGDGPFGTTYTGQVYNANADLQWRRPTSHAARGTFYANDISGSGRAQLGQSHGSVGDTVCRRGKMSGYDCGHLTSTAYKPTYSGACPTGPCNSTFALVGDLGTIGGDSGGPWFFGNYAYGIQKGGNSSVAIYSKLGYLPKGLDIVVE